MNDSTIIPEGVQALLGLFAEELREVRFPEVDAATLAAAADELRQRSEAVAAAERELERAHANHSASLEVLIQRSARALAYARVYAEEDAALLERLEAIHLPRGVRRPRAEPDGVPGPEKPRRRARVERQSASLPLEGGEAPLAIAT